jgi:lipid II:glycine glycyltransferase (peptidoglycan interpeptide bridge formation enzyme)
MAFSEWKVEVDRCTSQEWAAMMDLFSDANIYQTWAYGATRWGAENLSHIVLKRCGNIMAIAQLRIVRPTSLNFGMAYLRWGPLCEGSGQPLSAEVLARMAEALAEEYLRRRKLFLRIVPNAFMGSVRAEMLRSAFAGFAGETPAPENTYRTFLLDLAPAIEDLRRRLDKKWRNQLSRAEDSHLTVVSGSGSEPYLAFSKIYKEMRERKAFATTVDVDEFGRIQASLEERHRMRILLCDDQDGPVAGLVSSAMGDSAIYLLGATGDSGLQAKGAYLLQWHLIQRLKDEGIRWYDLGGIDPDANPGVYHFKKGLSGADVEQMAPVAACTSVVSSAAVKAGLAIRRVLTANRA